jgi:hypothetical protein
MGLDNYAVYGTEHPKYDHTEGTSNSIPDNLFPDNRLCGGMFSGGGNSFRGKVYNDVVEFFTGYSLYSDILIPQDVSEIYDALSQVTEERYITEFLDSDSYTYNISYEQFKDLTEWFGVVVKEQGSVISWY